VNARFGNGPYDGVVLNVPDHLDHIYLPVKISTVLMPEKVTLDWQARYRLVTKNDLELRYTFEGIIAR
jgi:hypothetical protein